MPKINITSEETEKLLQEVKDRTDAESKRILRYLEMDDLSRKETGPLAELAQRIKSLSVFEGFDDLQVPEIVPVKQSFDLFNFPENHPARSKSDTYFVNDEYILRPHTTVMWYYYLRYPEIVAKIQANEEIKVLCHGKVYRKDEIDRNHMNIFHQVDGLYLRPVEKGEVKQDELKTVLVEIAKSIFGENVIYRFNDDTFPYTYDSLEMEVDKDGKWIEVLGAGLVQTSVLEKLGLDPKQYTGWAFGFGLERLAIIGMELPDIRLLWSKDERVVKQLKLGQKFEEVSKFPPVIRDISFIVPKTFVPNDYFDLIRDIGGDLVEEVALTDSYENDEKFGSDRKSFTYRITYRSNERTLESSEIDPIQTQVYNQTAEQFGAELR